MRVDIGEGVKKCEQCGSKVGPWLVCAVCAVAGERGADQNRVTSKRPNRRFVFQRQQQLRPLTLSSVARQLFHALPFQKPLTATARAPPTGPTGSRLHFSHRCVLHPSSPALRVRCCCCSSSIVLMLTFPPTCADMNLFPHLPPDHYAAMNLCLYLSPHLRRFKPAQRHVGVCAGAAAAAAAGHVPAN